MRHGDCCAVFASLEDQMEQKRREASMDILTFGLTAFVFWTAVVVSVICICSTPASIVTFIVIWGIVLIGWMIAPMHDPGWVFYVAVLLSALYMLSKAKSEGPIGTAWAL